MHPKVLLPLLVLAALLPPGGSASARTPDPLGRIGPPVAGAAVVSSGLQRAADASVGSTILVRAGTRHAPVTVARGVTICVADRTGTGCARGTGLARLDGVRITAPGVRLAGFAMAGPVEVSAPHAVLRRNVLAQLDATVPADARLNRWTGAAPFLREDGTQDPPAPSVSRASHCSSAGFAPRFVEEAIWCANAGSTVVLHPSPNATPYQPAPASGGDPDGDIVSHNRTILGVDPIGEPVWAPGFNLGEPLDGLTICSGNPVTSPQDDPPVPSLEGAGCAPDASTRDGVVIDPVLPHALRIGASGVDVARVTLRGTVAVTGDDASIRQDVVDVAGDGVRFEAGGGGLVQGSTIRSATNGVVTGGSSRVDANTFDGTATAVRIEGPSEVTRNSFAANDEGVAVLARGARIRSNIFSPATPVAVRAQTAGITVDARLNDWGVASWRALGSRVRTDAPAAVLQLPYLRDGKPEPPLPGSDASSCAPHPDVDPPCSHLTVQAALDLAAPGATVTVPASADTADPTPRFEAPVVRRAGVRLCSTPASGAPPLDGCASPDRNAILEAGPDPFRLGGSSADTVVTVDAPGVTVRGFTLRRAGSSEATGVHVTAPGARIGSNTVTLRGGGCPLDDPGCPDAAPTTGIAVDAAGTTVDGNTLRTDVVRSDDGTAGGGIGIRGGATVDGNLVLGWREAIVAQDGAAIGTGAGNAMVANSTGVSGCAGAVRNSTFVQHGDAVALCGEMRLADNTLGLSNAAGLSLRTSGLDVEAECNDWGVYRADTIRQTRIAGLDGSTVDVEPFTAPGGASGPLSCLLAPAAAFATDIGGVTTRNHTVAFDDRTQPGSKPVVTWTWDFGDGTVETLTGASGDTTHRFSNDTDAAIERTVVLTVTDADGMTSVARGTVLVTVCTTDSPAAEIAVTGIAEPFCRIQDAVDAAAPGATVLVPPDTYFESVTVSTDGLTLCQGTDACASGAIEPDLVTIDGTVTADGTDGVTIKRMRVRGVSAVGSSGVQISDGVFEPASATAVRIDGSTGATVARNTMRGTWTSAVVADGAITARIEHNVLARCGVCVGAADASAVTVRSNTMTTTGTGIALSGQGHLSVSNTITGEQAATGVRFSGTRDARSSGDTFRSVGVGVSVGPSGSVQPSGTIVRDADLTGALAGLELTADTQGTIVDARLNDWGVYQQQLVRAKIRDAGTGNAVLYLPFKTAI